MISQKFYLPVIETLSIALTLLSSQGWAQQKVLKIENKAAVFSNSLLSDSGQTLKKDLVHTTSIPGKQPKVESAFVNFDQLVKLQMNFSKSGGSDSGGGNAVALSESEAKLVDLMTNEELKFAALNGLDRESVNLKIFGQRRYVKQLATEDSNFFRCANEKLSKIANLPSILFLISNLKSVKVLQVEFNIPNLPLVIQQNIDSGIPLAASESERLSGKNQTALAAYAFNRLWVSNRIYSKLSLRDQCGLAVHESLRHLNFISVLKKPLSQNEIELMTRFLMDDSLPEDGSLIEPTIQKLTQTSESAISIASQADEELRLANEALRLLLLLGPAPLQITECLAWEKQASKLQDQINTHSARNSKLTALSIATGLEDPRMKELLKNGLILGNALDSQLVETLPPGEFWDILTFTKITR